MRYQGVAGASGVAMGQAWLFEKQRESIEPQSILPEQVPGELQLLETAVENCRTALGQVRAQAAEELGEEQAAIFDAQLLFLDDPELIGHARESIEREHVTAAYAIDRTITEYSQLMSMLASEYMQARSADVEDLGERLVAELTGRRHRSLQELDLPAIVVARDVGPSDTAVMDKRLVLGMACELGSPTSHTIIMSRSLEIPAVVGVPDLMANVRQGEVIIIDGDNGIVIVDPTPKEQKQYRALIERKRQERMLRQSIAMRAPAQTADGHPVKLYANIGDPDEAPSARSYGAQGVGLLRTELFYMYRRALPTEEEQYQAYRSVVERFEGRPVVVRTLDIGGDKRIEALPLQKQENPFLGYRALRICLDRPDLFAVQLRAALRAAVHGDLRLMLPMASCVEEIRMAKAIFEEACASLAREGAAFRRDVPLGVMVEVPALAMDARNAAKEVDFFSIGTNDLCQYFFAADRMNPQVAHLYRPLHPALLRLIGQIIEAGHAEGIEVGMCGELAGVPQASALLLGLGLDEFSMSAPLLPQVKERLRRVTLRQARQLAERALDCTTHEEVLQLLEAEG